jgi:hypothetical protein
MGNRSIWIWLAGKLDTVIDVVLALFAVYPRKLERSNEDSESVDAMFMDMSMNDVHFFEKMDPNDHKELSEYETISCAVSGLSSAAENTALPAVSLRNQSCYSNTGKVGDVYRALVEGSKASAR